MPSKLTAKHWWLTMCLLLFATVAFSQQKTVTGSVTNGTTKEAIAGATVSVKGTTIATQTNAEGAFTITVPNERSVIVVSTVGFKSVEVRANQDNIQITLTPTTSNLDEVIITGYTSQKVKEVTGSVAVVKAKDLNAVPAGQAEQMLQGRVAGLNVITSGQPGEDAVVRLGGIGNFGNVTPLYIIDGIPGNINSLNPNDIESLQVLKDAGSAAIYGVRGGNGVIIVTTRRGRAGRPTITYDAYVGTQRPLKDGFGLLDTRGRADLYDLAVANTAGAGHTNPQYGTAPVSTIPFYIIAGTKNGVTDPNDPAADPSLYNTNYGAGGIYQITQANQSGTDWFHEIFQPATSTSHTVTAAGGSDKSRYLFSFGYLDQKGTLITTYLKRYTVRINNEFNIKNNIRVGENLQISNRQNPKNGNLSEGNAISMSYREQPIIPVHDIGGGYGGTRANGLGNASNPVADLERTKDNKGNNWGIFGNAYIEVDLFKYFTAKSSFGGNLDNYHYYNWTFHSYENAENNGSNGFSEVSGYGRSYTWTNTLQFNKVFWNDHNVKVLIGTEAIESYGREVGGARINFFLDDPDYRFLTNGSPVGQTNYSFAYTSSLYSTFGRLDYGYKDKYLVTGTLRRDGSSIFGPENRYGTFPAVSAAWRMTEEPFMKTTSSWLTDLKIRGSYGILGFFGNTDPFNQYTLFGGNVGDAYYDIAGTNNAPAQGFRAIRIGNPTTGWEKDIKTNFGADAVLWNGKLTFSGDWYKKKSTKLLFPLPLPEVLGGPSAPNVNVGDVQNTGFDFTIGSRGSIVNKDWRYDITAAVTTYKSEVVRLPNVPYFTSGGSRIGDFVRNQEGNPISAFYGYKVVGIFQSQADVDKAASQTDAAPGRFQYLDANGDGTINSDDRVFFGDPNPKVTAGLNIGISYKNFDFTTFFYGSFGNDVVNYVKYWIDFYQGFEGNKSTRALNESWTPTRPSNKVPIQEFTSNFSSDQVPNSYYLESGSYFRNKTMILGYTLPKSILTRAKIDRLRIYIQAVNLFTITDYSGLDPEIPGNSAAYGIDYGNYPNNQKAYLVGLNVTF